MKKLLLFVLILASLQSCRKEVNGIWIQTDVEFEYIATNPMVANETWANTVKFNMKTELKDRYGIDLDENELLAFKILGARILVNSAQCNKLSAISTILDFPGLDPFAKEKSGQALLDECDQMNATGLEIISFDENSTDADVQAILATDFADAINNGENLDIKYAMTAKETFGSQNSTITFILATKTQYQPK